MLVKPSTAIGKSHVGYAAFALAHELSTLHTPAPRSACSDQYPVAIKYMRLESTTADRLFLLVVPRSTLHRDVAFPLSARHSCTRSR